MTKTDVFQGGGRKYRVFGLVTGCALAAFAVCAEVRAAEAAVGLL